MAIKNRKHMVSYRLKNSAAPINVVIVAQDFACALGLIEDCLEEQNGEDPDFEWVLIRTESEARKQELLARRAKKAASRVVLDAVADAKLRVKYDVTDKELRDSGLLDGYIKALAEDKLS